MASADDTLWDQTLVVLVSASVGIIAAALAYEYIGGYAPCPLCLIERYAYYFAIPAGIAALFIGHGGYRNIALLVMASIAVGYAINTGLGVYHSGVEWKFWPGPASCGSTGGGIATDAGGLLGALDDARVVRCDEAPWRFLGLSFAGWNAVISFALAVLAVRAFRQLTHDDTV